MNSHVAINQFFSNEAKERVMSIFPEDGAQNFSQLVNFVSIAARFPNIPLVVPPEIDPCLHEVLAARDMKGNGLEKIKLSHVFSVALGGTERKTLRELDSPIAKQTCKILRKEGFIVQAEQTFAQGACTLTVIS